MFPIEVALTHTMTMIVPLSRKLGAVHYGMLQKIFLQKTRKKKKKKRLFLIGQLQRRIKLAQNVLQ